jgi:undecaprenyl-diphosphatase
MLTYIQASIMGGIQGVTELFPISSLGHSVIIPRLFGWHVDQSSDMFLAFLVATHLATALVLVCFFFKDWMSIVAGIGRSLRLRSIDERDAYAKLGWLIVVGTVPVGILGVLFEQPLQRLFASPRSAAFFLVLNGVLLWGLEIYKRRRSSAPSARPDPDNDPDRAIARLPWSSAVKIGCAECLALIPGFSRTGAALGGGLVVGLDHSAAARYSFLMATPVILAAAVLKLPELAISGDASALGPIAVGFMVAGICAYLSVRFLTKYFQTHTLKPFAIYCVACGAICLLSFLR